MLLHFRVLAGGNSSSASDTTPDAFSFTDQTNVELSTVITSNSVTITGINASATVTITGGEHNIAGAGWSSASSSVSNGQAIQVRHTSSASNAATTITVLTIGGVSGTFTATTLPVAGAWQLPSGHYETAKIPLEIIEPRAGLTTANRYYKAYPGLLYRAPVSVLGGAWPYRYEIVSAPSGMTLGQYYGDTDYGIINWPNPVTSGSPHTVQLRVTDQQGASATVTWTVTVTTSGFLFVDASNGNNANAGTLASPKQNIDGWYVNYNDTTYQGYFVYYLTGTYRIDAANDPTGQSASKWTRCFSDRKPNVHLAYPGHSPVWDATNCSFCFSNSTAPTVIGIGGANVAAGGSLGWVWWDSAPGAVIFECAISATAASGVGGTNPSVLMSRRNNVSNYQTVIGNTFNGVSGHDLFLLYDTNKSVIENNTISNYTGGGGSGQSHGFFFKESNSNASVRNNRGLTGNSAELVHVTMTGTFNNVEVCWNNYKSTMHGIWVGPNTNTALTNFQEYRNTWQVPYNLINIVYAGTMLGTWNSQRNVILHDGSTSTGILVDASEGGGANFAGTLTQNNLEGTAAERDVNATTGALTADDLSNYNGIYGHTVA